MQNNIPEIVQLTLINDILHANITDLDNRKLIKLLVSRNPTDGSVTPSELQNERATELLYTIYRIGSKYRE